MTQWQRILAGGYSAFFIYTLLSLTFGTTGLGEMKRLRAYKGLLKDNLTELEALHQNLESRAMSLRFDRDTLMVQAREIGYLLPGEGLILLGQYNKEHAPYPMGKMLKWTRTRESRKPLFRGIALSTGIILFILLGLFFPQSGVSRGPQDS